MHWCLALCASLFPYGGGTSRGVARNFIRGFLFIWPNNIPAYDVIVHHQNGCQKQSEMGISMFTNVEVRK